MKKQQKMFRKNKTGLVLFALVFAVIGIITLLSSFAESQYITGKITGKQPTQSHEIVVNSAGALSLTLAKEARKNTEAVKFSVELQKNGVNIAKSVASSYDDPLQLSVNVEPGTYHLIVGSLNSLSNRGVWYNIDIQLPDVEKDTLAPLVYINDSELLLNISGTVTITGTATDSHDIRAVRLLINGRVVQSQEGATDWSFVFDSTAYNNGTYELEVEAEDSNGNKGKSGFSSVINNTPPEEDSNPPIEPEDPVSPPTSPDPGGEPTTSTWLQGNVFEAAWATDKTTGWSYEESGALEKIISLSNYAECVAGGYDASTHYARIRRKLPERDDFAANKRFTIESTFELPTDFYSRHESYMRVITTDNYPGTMRSSGQKIGANDADEWRVGFTIYGGDGLFRLISAHQNNSSLILWKNGKQLPVGKHTVQINFSPSTTNSGAWELYIDGIKVGAQSNTQTVPATVAASELYVTRVGGCIDGATAQDNKSISVYLHDFLFRAER